MVVLTLKNLQQQTFTVDIEINATATVKDLKESIEKSKGTEYPSAHQKLIYAGRVMDDTQTLMAYNIEESKFIVIMVSKPKLAAVPVVEDPATPAPAAVVETPKTEAPAATPATTSTTPAAPKTETTTTTSTESGGLVGAESFVVTGDEFEKTVQNLVDMGYERPKAEKALRASFNNPYTAVQYLIDGIPEGLGAEGGAMEDPSPALGGAGAAQVSGESVDLDQFLRSNPVLDQMVERIGSDPQLLERYMAQLRTENPQMFQVICDNPQAFLEIVNEQTSGRASGGAAGAGAGAGAGEAGAAGGDTHVIQLTIDERQAIDRLRALGNFPEDLAAQAYFACDKNENQAAEFLFSQVWD